MNRKIEAGESSGSMSASELVAFLRERGVELRTEGGRLRFQAPQGALTPELRNQVVRRKEEIIAALRRSQGAVSLVFFEKLWEPIRLGRLPLRNRIVMSPMEVDFNSQDGSVTERTIHYYAERARGGVGLVVVEATCVDHPVGRMSPFQLRADADRFIPGLRRLARALRDAGAGVVLQLHHGGRRASSAVTGQQPVAPSPIADPAGELPRELTRDEIAAITTRFAEAARRALIAGFDGIQVHAAHGYLVAQFLSPLSNRRDDEYGGPLENRARFLLEVIAAIRERVGRHYPLLCRLSAADYEVRDGEIREFAGGLTPAEGRRVAELLEAGGVNAIDVSVTFVGPGKMHPMGWPEGRLAPLAAAVREGVSIPVSATARIPPELAETLLRDQKLDLVTMGRALIADPHLPRKVAENRSQDVIPCIYCQSCIDPKLREPGVICVVNPALGHEGDAGVKPAATPQKVLVVGGGPAGMEAARSAALRGHEVRLVEAGDALGGQMLLASKPRAAQETLERFRRYLIRQLEKHGVGIRLGERFTIEDLERWPPDVVVLATGVRAVLPEIPGVEGEQVLFAAAVLEGTPTGRRVAVVGSELVGCETALCLAAQGKAVTLLGRRPEPATKVTTDVRTFLLRALEERKITVLSGVDVEEIVAGGVGFRNPLGERETLAIDSVVLATGAGPDRRLLSHLEARVPRVLAVGDCHRPRGLREAIAEGYRAGLSI